MLPDQRFRIDRARTLQQKAGKATFVDLVRARRHASHARAVAVAAAAPRASHVALRAAQSRDVPALAAIEALCAGSSAEWSAADIQDELGREFARCLVAAVSTPGARSSGSSSSSSSSISGVSEITSGRSSSGGGEAVAFVVGWLIAGELQVLEVAVHPAHRRRGLAAALLRRLMLDCGCTDGAAATLEVRAGNAAAVALYRRLGFEEVGRRRRYYADGSDALLMTRPPGPLDAAG